MARKGENIRQRSDKRWEARFISRRTKDGRAVYSSVYGKTYNEAKQKRILAIAALLNGDDDEKNFSDSKKIIGSDVKFRFLCERWLDAKRGSGVKESTYNKYYNICHKYLIPGLGNIKCSDLTQEMLNGYIDDLVCLADSTVGTIITVINAVLTMAADDGRMERMRLKSRKVVNRDIIMPARGEIERLIRQMADRNANEPDASRIGILMCLFTGIRIGELCALRWSDLDLENKVMRVDKTLQRLQNLSGNENILSVPSSGRGRKSSGHTYLSVSSAKTNSSRRLVPLHPFLVELLQAAYDAPKDGVFFLSGTACPVEPRTMEYRFKRYLKETGLQDYRFHTLRHAFATRCVELGLEIKTLSEILGHASSSITMNKYVHPTLEMKRAFIGKVTFEDSPGQ